jgi:septum formation protein
MSTNSIKKNPAKNSKRTLVLASQSPRRKELLEKAGIPFKTFSVQVSEFLNENLNLDDAIMEIARQKAMAVIDPVKSLNLKDILILSSDTVVVLMGKVLGKPLDHSQAFDFLRRMSGLTHEVKTSICFYDTVTQKTISEIESSFVTFRDLSDEEIWSYIKTGDPMDKAGAYGIQGKAKEFIVELEGELDTVMGLPTKRVLKVISENNWDLQ